MQHVSFAPAVPAEAQLVVRSNRRTRVLFGVMLASVVLLLALVVAVPVVLVWATVTPLLGLIVVPLAVQLWFSALIVREYQGLLGPQLAADRSGVWVRTGLGSRPEVVFLAWPAVEGVDVSPAGPAVRILSRQGDALFPARTHWRVRTLRKRYGTPFVVDGRRSAEPATAIAGRLHQIASEASTDTCSRRPSPRTRCCVHWSRGTPRSSWRTWTAAGSSSAGTSGWPTP